MSGKYVRRQTLFVSSNDQPAGGDSNLKKSHNDFYVDLNAAVSQLQAEFGQLRDPDVRIYASVSHLWVPFGTGSKGFVQRVPPIAEYDQKRGVYYTPQVRLLRLHTGLLHGNASSRGGYSTCALEIPFMSNYHEADGSSPYSHAFVSYEKNADPENAGTFELANGLDNLSLARFWVTDERDHVLRTKSTIPIHLGLVIRVETAIKKRKRTDDTHALLREMVGMQRLQIVQADKVQNNTTGTRGLLTLQNEFDDVEDREDVERHAADDADARLPQYRKFLMEQFRRTREGPYYPSLKTRRIAADSSSPDEEGGAGDDEGQGTSTFRPLSEPEEE